MYEYYITVLDVGDGDTMEVKVHLGFDIDFTLDLRVLGVDTPEKYGVRGRCRGCGRKHTKSERLRERKAAEHAKAFVESLLEKADKVRSVSEGWDKFGGRYDGSVILEMGDERRDLTKLLIGAGHGYEYHGGTKLCFLEWYKLDIVEHN